MRKYLLYLFISAVTLFSGCQVDDDAFTPSKGRISIEMEVERIEGQIVSRSTPASYVSQFEAALYDYQGNRKIDAQITHNDDLSELFLDDLADGEYTLVLMGIGNVNDPSTAAIKVPDHLNEPWFDRAVANKTCDNEYFHAIVPVTVKVGTAKSPKVTLKRIVARVDVIPAQDNGMWSEGSLKEAIVSFDDGSSIYATQTASGTLGGPIVFKEIDVLKSLSFYTLPSSSSAKRTGTLFLKGVDNGGREVAFNYKFTISIEANKVAIIRPAYVADDNQFGTIRFYDRDRKNHTIRTFFQEGDSYKSIFARSFRPMQPITLSMQANRLVVSCYVAKAVKDVGIYMTQGNSDTFFEVAWLENINPYEEIFINLDQLPENKLYRTENGGVVMVEKLVLNSSTRFRYKGSDPFIKAVRDIRWDVKIQFVNNNDTVKFTGRGLCLRPIHARGAVALFTNMGYVMTSQAWIDRMKSYKIHGDSKEPIDIDNVLMPKILTPNSNIDHLVVNVLSPYHKDNANLGGLSYVGNGDFYCLEEPSFTRFITDDRYPRTTSYHEFGHVMGYGHNSNLTYGEMEWASRDIAGELRSEGLLPYNTTPEAIGPPATFYSVMRP